MHSCIIKNFLIRQLSQSTLNFRTKTYSWHVVWSPHSTHIILTWEFILVSYNLNKNIQQESIQNWLYKDITSWLSNFYFFCILKIVNHYTFQKNKGQNQRDQFILYIQFSFTMISCCTRNHWFYIESILKYKNNNQNIQSSQ